MATHLTATRLPSIPVDGGGLAGLWRTAEDGKLRQRDAKSAAERWSAEASGRSDVRRAPSLPPITPRASPEEGDTSGYYSEAQPDRCSVEPPPSRTALAGSLSSVRFEPQRAELAETAGPPPAPAAPPEPVAEHGPPPAAPPPTRDMPMTWRRQQHARQVAQLTRESELRRRAQTADRMKWGDRGVGISRLWDPCASTAHLPDVCGGRQGTAGSARKKKKGEPADASEEVHLSESCVRTTSRSAPSTWPATSRTGWLASTT
ncbi:uncharacterized protein LOC122378338 [Amphibalanus amphitrite]|uniref:uncharacterized protein LOC122378338 n=1 Tax=Amphibalanus amphitrite TaxID=1232801 RepID=UPI001C921D7C|nr:uncharacterized protein LOC122378338 [Amphibalanus amphitrite]